uniref:Uncharacterized protein n=1 Tax=Panagrolaimus sp. JU765 TaxID=591449 RepID=A0AC34PVS7_9BILA
MKTLLKDVLSSVGNGSDPTDKFKAVRDQIEKFEYGNEDDMSFTLWYKRYKHLFENHFKEDGKDPDEIKLMKSEKTELLISRLAPNIFKEVLQMTSPKDPIECDFDEIIKFLEQRYGVQKNLYMRRYNAQQIRREDDSLTVHMDKMNKLFDDLYMSEAKNEFARINFILLSLNLTK